MHALKEILSNWINLLLLVVPVGIAAGALKWSAAYVFTLVSRVLAGEKQRPAFVLRNGVCVLGWIGSPARMGRCRVAVFGAASFVVPVTMAHVKGSQRWRMCKPRAQHTVVRAAW